MHTVREPDLRPPTPPPLRSPALLPLTAHRSSLLSLSLSLSLALSLPRPFLSPLLAFLPFSPSAEQLSQEEVESPASRRKRECIIQFSSRYFTI